MPEHEKDSIAFNFQVRERERERGREREREREKEEGHAFQIHFLSSIMCPFGTNSRITLIQIIAKSSVQDYQPFETQG